MTKPISALAPLSIAARLKQLRKARNWTQQDLAEQVNVTQSQVAHWERDAKRPSPAALGKLSSLSDDADRYFWLTEAGLGELLTIGTHEELREIPVLKDAATAGTPSAASDGAINSVIAIPTNWLRPGGKLYAFHVVGDSMAPVVNAGYLVIVDISANVKENLIGRMVAAHDTGGVSIKWLRADGETFILVPNRRSQAYPIRILKSKGDHSLIGEVVKIIGDPPTGEDRGE